MPIHVLHLVRPAEGGIQEHVKELIWRLPQQEVQTTVACPADSPLYSQLPNWAEKLPLPIQDHVNPWLDWQCIKALSRLIDRQSADILHMHGAKASFNGRMAVLLSKHKPRLVCTFHNFVLPKNWFISYSFIQIEKLLAVRTDRYIAVSRKLTNQLQNQIKLPPHQVETVYNGLPPVKVHITKEKARTFLKLPPGAMVIGTMARLIPEKGVSDLLQAFRFYRLQGGKGLLAIIGDGPIKSRLQSDFPDLKEYIYWVGAIPEASKLIPAFDLYIQSSHKEGFGLAVLEAMLQGVPVIATNTGGIPEVIGDSRFAVLVPVKDPLLLSQHIAKLLQDTGRRNQLQINGKRRAEEHFSVAQMIQNTLRIYREILADRRNVL